MKAIQSSIMSRITMGIDSTWRVGTRPADVFDMQYISHHSCAVLCKHNVAWQNGRLCAEDAFKCCLCKAKFLFGFELQWSIFPGSGNSLAPNRDTPLLESMMSQFADAYMSHWASKSLFSINNRFLRYFYCNGTSCLNYLIIALFTDDISYTTATRYECPTRNI